MAVLPICTADDGEILYADIRGSGAPIIMLHGWTASHEEWLAFIDTLAARHRVIAWDARGHGGHKPTGSEAPTIARMARDLHQLLEYLAIDNATLVGHSMGALTTWEYISQFGTGRLSRLCLIDQSPKLLTDDAWKLGIYGDFDAARDAQFVAGLREDFAEAMMRFCAYGLNARARITYEKNTRGWQGERQRLRMQDADTLIRIWQSLVVADYRPVLAAIDIPSLLIYGGQSNFYPSTTGQYVRAQMPAAELLVYEEADHNPHLLEVARFLTDLQAFLARHPS